MLIYFVSASLALAVQDPAPAIETAFLAALASGDVSTVEGMLAEDVTIMHNQSGRPEPSTGAGIAAFLRGCEGRVQFEVLGDGPGAMAYNTVWSCGSRGHAEMLLWTANNRVVWVQLFPLEPAPDLDAPQTPSGR